MLKRIIDWSTANLLLVSLFTIAAIAGGIWAVKQTPLEALPDLSDVQVIVQAEYNDQAPRIVEDQVTYPIAAEMLKVPGSRTVRGYSFFGISFVYIIFEDGTDLYWARSRVLEYLNGIQGKLPANVTPTLGPDATGLGWVFQYALEDTTGQKSLAELRSIQDWYLRYALTAVPGVSEVATLGGSRSSTRSISTPRSCWGFGSRSRRSCRQFRTPMPTSGRWSSSSPSASTWCGDSGTSSRSTISRMLWWVRLRAGYRSEWPNSVA